MLAVRVSNDISIATYVQQLNEQLYRVWSYTLHEIPCVPMSVASVATTQLQKASKDKGGERKDDITNICDRNL